MKRLQSVLRANSIDTKTLRPVLETGRETTYALTGRGGQRGMELWFRLRALLPETKHWPVLLGEADDIELLQEGMEGAEEGASTRELLARAERLAEDPDPRAWFYQHLNKPMPEDDVTFGPWVSGRPNNHITTPYDLAGRPRESLEIGLVPTEMCWHVPVLMRYGSWNFCPPCEEHAALMKYWLAEYEAEPVAMRHDVIEMRVGKPPTTRDGARQLARQQYSYCTDIVSQGVETVEALAACLLRARAWYFWWD